MRCDYLVEAIGCIDSSIVDEAEDYKPVRKKHAWILAAASAACLLIVGTVIFRQSVGHYTGDACLKSIFAAAPVHEYVDYAETAERGKVTITDELKALLDECEEPPPVLFGNSDVCGWIFPVHITDADGASRYHILKNCIQPLKIGKWNEEEFLRTGHLDLTKKQIYSIKCPPECTIIIAPSMIVLNEEYLSTVTRDTLNVNVYPTTWNRAIDDDPYDSDKEAELIAAFFDEYTKDNGIDRERIKEYYEYSGCFKAELDKETIARLLADERTHMVCFITDG